jgi:TP901 family phage tail tape measure protein
MGFLPPVVATLLADTKEYSAKMDAAEGKMAKFGATTDTAGAKFTKFGKAASTAVIGVGVAVVAFAVDKGLKFQESLDSIQNQSGASAAEMTLLRTEILRLSDATAISSGDIGSAFLQIEKAGLRGARAYQMASNAAKAAVITGVDVTTMTTTLIAAQELQVNKGMSVAKTTDLIVEANRRHIGNVNTLVAVLSGKLGGALAATGISFAQIAAIADVSSKGGYTQARSMVMLATALAKVENPTHATTKSLLKMNINAAALASEAKRPGGLIQVLEDLRVQSIRAHIPLASLFTGVFGASSLGLVTLLNNNLGELKNTTTILNRSSGVKLNTAFDTAKTQIQFQLRQIETQLVNAATRFGLKLIPYLKDATTFLENALQSLETHPARLKAIEISLGTAFAAAVGLKIAQALQSTVQTGLLTQIAANTLKTALVPGGGTVLKNAPLWGTAWAGEFSTAVAAFGSAVTIFAGIAGAAFIVHNVLNPTPGALGKPGGNDPGTVQGVPLGILNQGGTNRHPKGYREIYPAGLGEGLWVSPSEYATYLRSLMPGKPSVGQKPLGTGHLGQYGGLLTINNKSKVTK